MNIYQKCKNRPKIQSFCHPLEKVTKDLYLLGFYFSFSFVWILRLDVVFVFEVTEKKTSEICLLDHLHYYACFCDLSFLYHAKRYINRKKAVLSKQSNNYITTVLQSQISPTCESQQNKSLKSLSTGHAKLVILVALYTR